MTTPATYNWLDQFRPPVLNTGEQKALVYARKTGRVDNAA